MSAYARHSDPETSHEAAAGVDSLPARQQAVLDVLRLYGPLADAQLAVAYHVEARLGPHSRIAAAMPNQSPSGLRTRRSELVRDGLVRDSGVRIYLDTGRRAIVWKAL